MRVGKIENKVIFKSGHATFGSSGHLSNRPNIGVYDLVYIGYRPSGILESQGKKLEYLA